MHAPSYHLKFELYASPVTNTHDQLNSSGRITSFVAPAGTDLFGSTLPAHRTHPWSGEYRHASSLHLKNPSRDSTRTPELRPASVGKDSGDQAGDALLLPERNPALKELPLHIPSSPQPSSKAARRDWRFASVTIDGVDMEPRQQMVAGLEKHGAKVQNASHTRAEYVPSDIKSTDAGWGVVHLYKDVYDGGESGRRTAQARKDDGAGELDLDKCSTLCILAVPSWMMPSDLLGFVGDQAREDVSHFRLIRTGRTNKYMVLMKFRSPKKARDWQRAWNGRLFSAMEPENCHVVFIKSVEFISSDGQQALSFPQNTHDAFTNSQLPPGTKPYAPPTPALIELPTCPVCLERMDETTGLLTILCQHVFHCACLEKWRGSGCPVCRYTQSPSSTFPYPRPDDAHHQPPTDPECSICASTTNLWICLICGSIGCGRYDSAHAYAHYEETSHCYAMDIMSQHVWDYAGDGYVHRLIQNKEPALSAPSSAISMPYRRDDVHHQHPNAAYRAEPTDLVPREKMEAMANEYTFLLTSQLDGQRRYFEEQMQRAVGKASAASARADDAQARLEDALQRLDAAQERADATRASLASAERASSAAGRRGEKFESMAREALRGLKEEKTVSEGLMGRIRDLEGKMEASARERDQVKAELEEAKELNRDLTMFVEGREKLREIEEREGLERSEVEGGEVVVGQAKGRRKGRKR